jgi:hypothetical protein
MAGDQFTLVWTVDVVTDISFAAYDAIGWIKFSCTKTSILANNHDSSIIYVKIYLADKVTIDTTYTGMLDINIKAPFKGSLMRFIFSKGQASKLFKTSTEGAWNFPVNTNLVGDHKLDKTTIITINAVM